MDTTKVQPGDAFEDPVAGHQLETQHQGGGGDPPVGLMHLLQERVTGPAGLVAQLGAPPDQRRVRLDDVQVAERALEPTQPEFAPSRAQSTELQLGNGHERDHPGARANEDPSPLGVG